MLAVLFIKMKWWKENRTSNGAVIRQEYYKPIKMEDGVNLSGNGVFVVKCQYHQHGETIYSDWEASDQLDKKLYKEYLGKAFTASDERKHKSAARRIKAIQKRKGAFYELEDIDIPCIKIHEEPNNCYCIQWQDCGLLPRRRGGNKDFYKSYKKSTKLMGQPNTLNETAFILEEGKAGVLRYNTRCISFDDQWYECYYVYMVHEKVLTQDIFVRTYDYEYNQLAYL